MVILSLALAFLGACEEETGNIGSGILPNIDSIATITVRDTIKIAKTYFDGNIRLDEATYSFLGSVNDLFLE